MVKREELLKRMALDPLFLGKAVMPDMFTAAPSSLHRDMRQEWMSGARFTNWIAPRGHAKSSIVAGCLPLHHLHFSKGPHVVVLVSKTEGHAIRLLDTLKDTIEYSHSYRDFFGYRGRHKARRWTSNEIILENGDVITSRGMNQQVVGLKYGHQRPTLIIVDDPEDLSNTKTEDAVITNRKWLMTQLFPTIDPTRGKIWVVGTPQHQQGIVNYLHTSAQHENATWRSHHYSAVLDEATHTVLWPEWMSWDRLQEFRRGMPEAYFVREYLCRIISEELQLFKDHYIRWWDGSFDSQGDGWGWLTLKDRDGERKILVNVFMGIDPASSTRIGADYTVIMPVAVDSDNNRYVLPYVRKRMPPSQVVDEIVRQYYIWKPGMTMLETSGQQEIYRDILNNLENVFIPGLTVKNSPRDAKEKRYLAGLEPYFVRGKVYLQRGMEDFRRELLEFTTDNRHAHDDQIDALYYAFKPAYAPPKEYVPMDEEEHTTPASNWMLA